MKPGKRLIIAILALSVRLVLAQGIELVKEDDGRLILKIDEGVGESSRRVEMAGINFQHWFPVDARQNPAPWNREVEQEESPSRFFRLTQEMTPQVPDHASWKREINLFDDPFHSAPAPDGSGEELRWIKFVLRLDDLPEVYFQDTTKHPFHYDFASQHLGPGYQGMARDDFNALSLFHDNRKVVLGTVLMAPGVREYAIQFVGQDVFPIEMVRFLYQSIDARIKKPEGVRGFYLPTTEQTALAQQKASYLERHGIKLASADRWLSGDGCYVTGWALGRLIYVPTPDIDQAYRDGTLRPSDILLTDAIPAEIPFVSGILSLQPATPNSHVAILARSYGVPFAYLSEPTQQVAVQALAGKQVYLKVSFEGWGNRCEVRVFATDTLDPDFLAGVLAFKEMPALNLKPIEPLGKIAQSSLDTVTHEDIRFIGGKAANFGVLRRAIPDHSPSARAFTFDLWTAYLAQPLPAYGNRSLLEEINRRLDGITWPPSDMAAVDTALKGIRELMKQEANFSPSQRAEIFEALTGLDSKRKVRFRSSTNVEDSASFIGAGLYDSFSGCIMDDTDGDELGPSHCDPSQPKERGVFRAMRKVYASFYNLNAYLERLRRGVDESQVGMAILVHYSYPDQIEVANGVATAALTIRSNFSFYEGNFVNQVGAESVTNPEGDALPEVIRLSYSRLGEPPGHTRVERQQRSSRLAADEEHVMTWKEDYETFAELFFQTARLFQEEQELETQFELEFETKKLTSGDLVVKQVRQIPKLNSGVTNNAAAMLNEPLSWRVFQGEASNVFANHRLKSLWHLSTDNRWLNEQGLTSSFFGPCRAELISQCGELAVRDGQPDSWPDARWTRGIEFARPYARQIWSDHVFGSPAELTLDIGLNDNNQVLRPEVVTLRDLRCWLRCTYEIPQIGFDHRGEIIEITEDIVHLEPGTPERTPRGADKLVTRMASVDEVAIETRYYWPPDPILAAGYTAPLERWDQTTISGLTPEPLILRGYYSQSYRPEHHNFGASFVFEPGLENGVTSAQIDILRTKNIKQIYLGIGYGPEPRIWLIGFNGQVRKL